nr:MBG domain-containing protein [Oscillochloris sp. ZM17-4]
MVPVSAASLDLTAAGVLDLAAGARLDVAGPAALRADALIITGDLVATRVSAHARAVVQAGVLTAPSIAVRFAEIYQATAAARLDARGDVGGVVVLDGGPTGHLFTSGAITATGATGAGGRVDLLGHTLELISATVDASGAAGGGRIRVGGDLQGRNPAVINAAAVTLARGTALQANAIEQGNGGRIIVWSDGLTEVSGAVSVRGGWQAGDGGFVELSGKTELRLGATPDVSAPAGHAGEALLDPKNLTIAADGALPQFELHSPTPAVGDTFGNRIVPLTQGSIVVIDVGDDAVAKDAGAVYLFDGLTGALLSTLTGSKANDQVGSGGVTALSSGNFVVRSPLWDNGTVLDAGAVTWGSGAGGTLGAISAANSLVGSTANDQIGSGGMTALPSGNFVARSPLWDNGTVLDAGAITWGSGVSGITGPISAANSLVGSTSSDRVGSSIIITLKNGNYVAGSWSWDNGALANVGAMTWGSGDSGVTGPISADNSLIGSSAEDQVGGLVAIALANGNYVVSSPWWDNNTMMDVGAVTWGNGDSGVTGIISADNSLIGSSSFDIIGDRGVTQLTNSNYVVLSSYWTNGAAADAGAITWGSGTGGTVGPVSAANSLVGSTTSDRVGNSPIIPLSNGNYVVPSGSWDNGAVVDAGAVTWGNGMGGTVGPVSADNSLVGSSPGDYVSITFALTNGNYIVRSGIWDNGAVVDAGAVTWGNGMGGTVGPISAANSLVGSSPSDRIGEYHAIALSNGNYVISSPNWDNGAATNAGAVTWGSGTGGTVGPISAANSLVGSATADQVGYGYLTALKNGNYVVSSPWWDNGAVVDAGAATWGSGTSGVMGVVSADNSLVGTTANDKVCSSWPTAVGDGNYVVSSPRWDNGPLVDVGAVTWGDGASGIVGPITAANSLVGSSPGDFVGNRMSRIISHGNYLVKSPNWDNGPLVDAGAITWGDGASGIVGPITAANSLVGTTSQDGVGDQDIFELGDDYIIPSPGWDNGAVVDAGAVIWGSGAGGPFGPVSAANSILNTGSSPGLYADAMNKTFIVQSSASGGRVVVGFTDAAQLIYARAAAESLTVRPELLAKSLGVGAALTLQASNDLSLTAPLAVANPDGPGGTLTLSAGRSIHLDADLVTDSAPLILIANDTLAGGVVNAQCELGDAHVQMTAGSRIDAGTAAVLVDLRGGDGKTYAGLGAAELTDITGIVTVQGAPLAPGGATLGTTTITGSLSLSGGLQLTVNGTADGQRDQVSVNGPVTLGGPLTMSASDYTPSPGDVLLLIANDGSDAVSGVFDGLSEGTTVMVGSIAMTLSYAGGDGNDITLTAPSTPPAFDSAAPPAGSYGASYSHTFTASGEPAPSFSVTTNTLPPGLSLNPMTGVLSGTPTKAGTYVGITVSAANGPGAPATQTFTLVIDKAPLAVKANGRTRGYGEANPALTYRVSGLVNNDTAATALTGKLTTIATASSSVGTYPITQGTLAAANYTITYTEEVFTITPALLMVAANNQTVVAGGQLPALTYVVSGLMNGDTATTALTGMLTTTATARSPVGTYPITQGTLAAANYTIRFTGGVLSVISEAPVIPSRLYLPMILTSTADHANHA